MKACQNNPKKQWHSPLLSKLQIKYTKSGTWNSATEGGIWIFTWGPQS